MLVQPGSPFSVSTMNLYHHPVSFSALAGGGGQARLHQGLPERDHQGGCVLGPQAFGAGADMACHVLQHGAVGRHAVDGQ